MTSTPAPRFTDRQRDALTAIAEGTTDPARFDGRVIRHLAERGFVTGYRRGKLALSSKAIKLGVVTTLAAAA